MGGRDRQDIREVVEAAVRGLVSGQQRPDVEAPRIEREQVADGVAVLRAIQAMDGVAPARIWIRRPRPIDCGLQRAGHCVVGRRIGTRQAGRRHRAGPKLRDHPLPDVRVGVRPGDVQTVERQSGSPEPLVVAGDAVGIEERPGRGRGRGGLRLHGRDTAGDDEREDRRAPHPVAHDDQPPVRTSAGPDERSRIPPEATGRGGNSLHASPMVVDLGYVAARSIHFSTTGAR